MSDLRFVTVRLGDKDDAPHEIVTALPSGALRVVALTESEALRVIKDLAEGLHVLVAHSAAERVR